MVDIDPVTGQPKDLGISLDLSKETDRLIIRVVERKFRKSVTIITGFSKDVDVKQLGKKMKQQLACGGTAKNNIIELQGNHKEVAKKILIKEGFREDLIQT